MNIAEFMGAYDVDARSSEMVEFEETGNSQWPEFDHLYLELENKALFFGRVIRDVVDLSVRLNQFGDDVEAKLEAIDADTRDHFQNDLMNTVDKYDEWALRALPVIDRELGKWATNPDPGRARKAEILGSHLNFHWLSFSSIHHWAEFISLGAGGSPPSRASLANARHYMSLFGARHVRERELKLRDLGRTRSEYLKGEVDASRPDIIEGRLNEIDAGVALAYAAEKTPNGSSWVLPMPPQFEYLAGDKNVDYAVLDLTNSRALGIQVKSSGVLQAETQVEDGIVYLSGRHDLGNSYALPNEERGKGFKNYSYAGHLAIASLAKIPPRSKEERLLFQRANKNLIWLVGYARQKGRPAHLDRAAENVQYHIDRNL